nr:MAG TPA: hypothetical protein [Caudoviricetes sp.]DAZ26732.1 MAG TPA: hypothetical protein [Caudoviricetes sp.]
MRLLRYWSGFPNADTLRRAYIFRSIRNVKQDIVRYKFQCQGRPIAALVMKCNTAD